MSVYRVTWNGQDILDYASERLVLLSPHHENEINVAGSLRFVVPPQHLFYEMFTEESMLISDVELYEDGELIWFGRPLTYRKDFFNQKEIYCEGALGFFNDSIQEKSKYEGGVHEFFRSILFNHNYQVDTTRRILPGNITVEDKNVYREPNYEKSLDVLRGQCIDTNGGYFFLRKENGEIYLDWLTEMPFTCNQTIEFAENMLNVSKSFDGTDFATCVMPLGASDEHGDPLTIYNINNNNHILESDMASIYGRIVQVVQFGDIEDPYELKEEGQKALDRILYNSHTIECSAADLHSRDGSKEMFRVGQMVHCYSEPHGLEIDLPLSKIALELDTAAKQITLGIIPKPTLSRISKKKESQSIGSGTINVDPTYTDDSGIDWEIIMPTDPGGSVTANPMPTHIEVARAPNKTEYEPGDALDFTGIVVNIRSGDKSWTNPPRYIDGTAPMSELTFSTKKAPDIEEFGVDILWEYKGKRFWTSVEMTTAKAPVLQYITLTADGTPRRGEFISYKGNLPEELKFSLYSNFDVPPTQVYLTKYGEYLYIAGDLDGDGSYSFNMSVSGGTISFNDSIASYFTTLTNDYQKFKKFFDNVPMSKEDPQGKTPNEMQ